MRRIIDGNGPLDARLEIELAEYAEGVILNVSSNNGEHGAGIHLNRVAIVDLIGMLAKALADDRSSF